MPAFREKSRLPVLSGDPVRDIKSIADAFFQLEEELGYMFRHIGLNNGLKAEVESLMLKIGDKLKIAADGSGITAEVVSEIEGELSKLAAKVEITAGEIASTVAKVGELKEDVEKISPYTLQIVSSNGAIFKNGQVSTTLIAAVRYGGKDITDTLDANQFRWTRVSADLLADEEWNSAHYGGCKSVEISSADVSGRATFFCDLIDPATGLSLL